MRAKSACAFIIGLLRCHVVTRILKIGSRIPFIGKLGLLVIRLRADELGIGAGDCGVGRFLRQGNADLCPSRPRLSKRQRCVGLINAGLVIAWVNVMRPALQQ